MPDKNPRQLVEETHRMVQELHESQFNQYGGLESRLPESQDTTYAKIMNVIMDVQPATSTEIAENIDEGNITRSLTRLYHTYHLNRSEKNGNYEYETTALGEKYAESLEEQKKLDSTKQTEQEKPPWHDTDVCRGEYYALKAIHESDERKSSRELNERYCELLGTEPSNADSIKVAARLSELYEEDGEGYVGRPPNKPYVYWLTDKGRQLIND